MDKTGKSIKSCTVPTNFDVLRYYISRSLYQHDDFIRCARMGSRRVRYNC